MRPPSDSTGGAKPRSTVLGLGPSPFPAAPREAEREGRATVPGLPRHRAQSAESHRSAQLPGDITLAPRPPVLRAPVRLRGRWPASSLARLSLARVSGSPWSRASIAALVAVAIVVFEVKLSARPAALPDLRADAAPPGPSVALTLDAPSTPEPHPSAAPRSSAPSAPPAARAPRASPAKRRAGPARAAPTTDVLDPWKE